MTFDNDAILTPRNDAVWSRRVPRRGDYEEIGRLAVYECLCCASLVVNRDRHDRFHDPGPRG